MEELSGKSRIYMWELGVVLDPRVPLDLLSEREKEVKASYDKFSDNQKKIVRFMIEKSRTTQFYLKNQIENEDELFNCWKYNPFCKPTIEDAVDYVRTINRVTFWDIHISSMYRPNAGYHSTNDAIDFSGLTENDLARLFYLWTSMRHIEKFGVGIGYRDPAESCKAYIHVHVDVRSKRARWIETTSECQGQKIKIITESNVAVFNEYYNKVFNQYVSQNMINEIAKIEIEKPKKDEITNRYAFRLAGTALGLATGYNKKKGAMPVLINTAGGFAAGYLIDRVSTADFSVWFKDAFTFKK